MEYQDVAADYLAVWNETNAETRGQRAAELFTDDVVYTDPFVDVQGVAALSDVIGSAQQQFAGMQFQPCGAVDGHHRQIRFGWELGPKGQAAPIAGFDVVACTEEGRIYRVLGFIDRVPA